MIVTIDYYLPSTVIEESIRKAGGTHQFTIIHQDENERTIPFQLFASNKLIHVETFKENSWNFEQPFLLNQVDFGKMMKILDKSSTFEVKENILSVHKVRIGGLSLKDEEVWLLVNSNYGKRRSLLVKDNYLYEFPKTGTFHLGELNKIGMTFK